MRYPTKPTHTASADQRQRAHRDLSGLRRLPAAKREKGQVGLGVDDRVGATRLVDVAGLEVEPLRLRIVLVQPCEVPEIVQCVRNTQAGADAFIDLESAPNPSRSLCELPLVPEQAADSAVGARDPLLVPELAVELLREEVVLL